MRTGKSSPLFNLNLDQRIGWNHPRLSAWRILARAGMGKIAVIAPAFSADCIETLEEINEEIRDSFIHAGGTDFTYIPCLNAQKSHIDVLCDIIQTELAGWV